MANTSINIKTESELKDKAQAILSGLGIDMSTAVNMFLRQIVDKNGIPYNILSEDDDINAKRTPVFGCAKGEIWIADDFDEPLEEFKEYME